MNPESKTPRFRRQTLSGGGAGARSGFSFIEVMFAVVVLGIGFIMVSAMFPVAIQQTQLNVEDLAAVRANLAAQTNFAQLKQDLTIFTSSQPNSVTTNLYYGWPMSVGTSNPVPPLTALNYPGKIYSFRDNRWTNVYTNPLWITPPASVVPVPPQFALDSNHVLAPVQGLWERIRGSLICQGEPQFAYVPMFQRGYSRGSIQAAWTANSTVNIFAFLAAARNRIPYTYTANNGTHSDAFRNGLENPAPLSVPDTLDTALSGIQSLATFEPRRVQIKIHIHGIAADPTSDPVADLVQIYAVPNSNTDPSPTDQAGSPDAAGPGGFLIISDDNPASLTAPNAFPGLLNGIVLRLGNMRSGSTTSHSYVYELQPGFDITSATSVQLFASYPTGPWKAPIDVMILGRQLRNPNLPYDGFPTDSKYNPYDGAVQDIGVQQFSLTLQ